MKNIERVISKLKSWTSFRVGEHPIKKILRGVPEGKYLYKGQLLIKLKEGLNNKDAKLVEFLISICNHDGVDKDYTGIFCKLLKEDWQYMHEDIVMLLEDIKDPDSINCIYETSLNIPSYDDGRSLAKKCIWALGAIDTVESKEKLRLLANLDDPIIKEAASMELQDEVSER